MFPSVLRKSVPLFACASVLASTNLACQSETDALERTTNGVSIHASTGVIQLEVCSDRVIHIVASRFPVATKAVVPVVVRPCAGTPFTTSSDSSDFHIVTKELRIEVRRDTGLVRFLSRRGDIVLREEPKYDRTTGSADGDGSHSESEQTFLLSSDEALYGLGQHQEGFLNLRDIPIRLLQADTDIAIPFLISSMVTDYFGTILRSRTLTPRLKRSS